MPSHSRSPLRIGILLCLAAIGILFVVAAVQIYWAREHLLTGAHELQSAITTVKSPAALKNPGLRTIAVSQLAEAQSNFASARNDLYLWSPILSRLSGLPGSARQISAAPQTASAAYFATTSALDVVRGVDPLWPQLSGGVHSRPLLVRLAAALSPGAPQFRAAAGAASQGLSAVATLPADTGSYSLNQAVAKLRRDLPKLHSAALWLSAMPQLLGWKSPSRFLFAWENSQEIRAVGGFIGATDLVTVRRGHMTKHFTGSILPHEIRFPRLPQAEAVLTAESSWLFRDSNFSPDFPTSARLERYFYGRDTGSWPSGVVDFVDQGVPDILYATGPVYVPQYHVWVTSRNATTLANRFAGPGAAPYRGPLKHGNRDTIRKQFLGFEFAAIVRRLEHLPVSRWPQLAHAMTDAVIRHDILIYHQRPAVEAAVRSSGLAGSFPTNPGDFLYIVDDNRSYNKISPYVEEHATYTADLLPNYWIDSTVTIHYRVLPSPSSMEGVGPEFGRHCPPGTANIRTEICGTKHDFLDFLRVYVPAGAQLQATSGLERVAAGYSQAAYGRTQLSGYFLLRQGRATTVTFTYQTPANALGFDGFRRYDLTVPRQPGAMLHSVLVRVHGVAGVRFSLSGRTLDTYVQNLFMTRDRRIQLQIAGGSQPQQVALPSQPPNGDPFIPWSFLRGGRGRI